MQPGNNLHKKHSHELGAEELENKSWIANYGKGLAIEGIQIGFRNSRKNLILQEKVKLKYPANIKR